MAGAGFLGGALTQRARQPDAAATVPAAFEAIIAARAGGGAGLPGGAGVPAGAPAAGSGAVTGTVRLVDGANVYVADAQGNITKVVTTAGTVVTTSQAADVSALAPPATVVVQGTVNPDGTVTATRVSES